MWLNPKSCSIIPRTACMSFGLLQLFLAIEMSVADLIL